MGGGGVMGIGWVGDVVGWVVVCWGWWWGGWVDGGWGCGGGIRLGGGCEVALWGGVRGTIGLILVPLMHTCIFVNLVKT